LALLCDCGPADIAALSPDEERDLCHVLFNNLPESEQQQIRAGGMRYRAWEARAHQCFTRWLAQHPTDPLLGRILEALRTAERPAEDAPCG
jgi:hypothetical protein